MVSRNRRKQVHVLQHSRMKGLRFGIKGMRLGAASGAHRSRQLSLVRRGGILRDEQRTPIAFSLPFRLTCQRHLNAQRLSDTGWVPGDWVLTGTEAATGSAQTPMKHRQTKARPLSHDLGHGAAAVGPCRSRPRPTILHKEQSCHSAHRREKNPPTCEHINRWEGECGR